MTHEAQQPQQQGANLSIEDKQRLSFFEHNLFKNGNPKGHEAWPGFITLMFSKGVKFLGIKRDGPKTSFEYCCGEPNCQCDELINISDEYHQLGDPEEPSPDENVINQFLQPALLKAN